jgi:hypothetical protein
MRKGMELLYSRATFALVAEFGLPIAGSELKK